MSVKTKIRFLFLAVFLTAVFFTTCESPMGMGDSIDWEPPVLMLDPLPSPLYVRNGTEITGTATDNIKVTKVVLSNSITGEILSTGKLDGDNFEFVLNFDESRNGEKIMARIDAYDRAGNNDSRSTAFITIIIDIRKPIIGSKVIRRTDNQVAYLLKYNELKALEDPKADPNGEKKDNIYKYQNGWFRFEAEVEDKETQVEIVSLKIYDAIKDINYLLKEYTTKDNGTSTYYPAWTIHEEDIIAAGAGKWGTDYETNYYNKNERYYYRVVVSAIDKSKNEATTAIKIDEDEGFICLWAKSDEPKGIFDTTVYVKDKSVSRGAQLPVDFFDDDMLSWAFAGLITKEQWEGTRPLASGVYICGATVSGQSSKSTEEKIQWLKEKITGLSGTTVDGTLSTPTIYNWRYDKYNSEGASASAKFENQVTTKVDQKLIYVPVGNETGDYGDYVLFTIAADKKTFLQDLATYPNGGSGPKWTNTNIWRWNIWDFSVVDQNAPLIVFDTTNGCPEENTFPSLKSGEFFTINGYTLRDAGSKDASGKFINSVTTFRMAWIPNALVTDATIEDVKVNLKSGDYSSSDANIKYYPVTEVATVPTTVPSSSTTGKIYFQTKAKVDASSPPVNDMDKDGKSRIQKFSIDFSVFDDFMYEGDLENTTKLFVFYAQDNMKNEVYRELRLLGSKSVPEVTVYDATNASNNSNFDIYDFDYPSKYPNGLPDPNKFVDPSTGGLKPEYYTQLGKANDAAYSTILSAVEEPLNTTKVKPSVPFLQYPRGTIIKYWLKVKSTGLVDIASIKMEDITYSGDAKTIGTANTTTKLTASDGQYYSLSFCEYYPDVSQRTFLFTVTDKLKNTAKVQRTIAITNAAQLDNISTTSQSATYGAGKTITLQANFTGQVYLKDTTDPDKNVYLNVAYNMNGSSTLTYQSLPVKTRPTKTNPLLALEFDFKVPENASGQLLTMHANLGTGNVPLSLNGNKILDSLRGEGDIESEAFIPGVVTGTISVPNWSDDTKSLQEKKTIMLDGKKPAITTTSVGGKDPYKSTNEYYFKSGETIELTLSTDASTGKEISVKGTPKLSYKIKRSGGNTETPTKTTFTYSRPNGAKSLVFTLPTSNIDSGDDFDGEIVEVTLVNDANNTIIDNYDNPAETALTDLLAASGKRVFIKKTKPITPPSNRISGIADFVFGANPTTEKKLNYEPSITVSPSTSVWTNAATPTETINWESTQFSKDNGVTWTDYTSAFKLENAFKNTVQVRYTDRAGNNGDAIKQLILVNEGFPKLVAASATQSIGWYKLDSNLEFNLSFASEVILSNASNVKITLSNDGQSYSSASPEPAYQVTLQANSVVNKTTVKFNWNSITNKEMQTSLYISKVELSGLSDPYGNIGGTGTGTAGGPPSGVITVIPVKGTPPVADTSYTCYNLPKGIKVDAIAPAIDTTASDGGRTPKHNTPPLSTDNTLIKEIKLTFRENVMKGSGVITIRPRGNYAIPPVLEDSSYYLGYKNESSGVEQETGVPAKFNSAGTNRTYISSFYDIYNTNGLTSDERKYLTDGTSMSSLTLNTRTGQSKGPYKKTTHGLIEGAGYTGDYNNTSFAGVSGTSNTSDNGANGPNLSPIDDENTIKAMIPDTSTKWVLDYQYLIDDTTNDSAVSRIRGVLTKAKWRWQEIDVVNIQGDGSKTITIPLNEPLLKGLEWDVYYPAGTFTDMAGNPAPASGSFTAGATNGTNNDYYFMSPGVQTPVIRVDRRSYDARNSDWSTPITNSGANPSHTAPGNDSSGWSANTYEVSDNGLGTDKGWGINDFNSVHYRVECETPGATIAVKYHQGSYANKTGAKGGWDDNGVAATNGGSPIGGADVKWNVAAANIPGTWILPNIIRRSSNGTDSFTYSITTKYGTSEERKPRSNYRGFRSYNRDLKKSELVFSDSNTLLTNAAISSNNDKSKGQGVLTGFGALESSKSYIVAQAGKNGQTATGYEGIFRTVIQLNYGTTDSVTGSNIRPTNDNFYVEGSNIKNGMPSIAGFPVQDAAESGDARFVKKFYKLSSNSTQYYWVSTEIVCEWYFLCFGGGGSHQACGEVNNYQTVGYGDLTFGHSITRSGRE